MLFVAVPTLSTVQPLGAQNTPTCTSSTPSSVWTAQYGNLRQNYNNSETVLTSSCLSNFTITPKEPTWSPLQVDSSNLPAGNVNPVYAQPLFLAQVPASAGLPSCPTNAPCNVLIVATLNGSIFAFNAGDGTTSGGTGAGGVIWRRTGTTSGAKTNYLWFDDCMGTAPGPSTSYGKAGLPFAGIVSTPVLDTSATPDPVMYVTSLCQTALTGQTQQWWIHQIDLYTGYDVAAHQQIQASVPGSDNADDLSSGSIPFNAWETLQRSALLKVSVSGATPNPLIYLALGFATGTEIGVPYHGWIFAYDSGLNRKIAFATTTRGITNNTDTPVCTPHCGKCTFPTGCPPSQCVNTGYLEMPNWCGHGAGVWMSGRGAVANTDSTGLSHAYFGVGNGPFQQTTSDGAIHNWGSSVVDLTQSATVLGTSPSEYFTPNGNAVGGGTIPVTPPVSGAASYSYQGMNQDDFDMSVSGIMGFDDASGNHRLVTFDKAGYGYLFTQGNLCGDTTDPTPQCFPGAPTGYAGLAAGDLGNIFPFAGNATQCPDQETNDRSCDRITSLAFDPDTTPKRLYVWPSFERLTSLELTNNQPITPGGVTIGSNGTAACGSGTTFTQWVIPGDTITDTQTGSADNGESRIVTQVVSDTQLTLSSAFSPNIGSCTSACSCTSTPDSFSYSGYFARPRYDTHPMSANVQYPGGSVVVTSNAGSGGVLWGLANVGSSAPGDGVLVAYDAGTLGMLWCSNSTSCSTSTSAFLETTGSNNNASFAIPTVVNGYVYVPTSGIQTVGPSSGATNCSTSSPCSGVLVISGHNN